ncbi:MAG TPA: tRNA lysidine(34) synthetase TilS [Syntrophales bacterium]|nr:tRNA lysidine(34) synthetase TilS [Syntrophales bacterium]
MLNKVRAAIEGNEMLRCGDRVVVAISGGPDSVALLAVLQMLAGEYGFALTAAHLNHGFRIESGAEERFVTEFCASRGVPLDIDQAEISGPQGVPGKFNEDLARKVRYAFLERTARKRDANRIALGHHLQDQAETILMNLLRGGGSEGLKGMVPVRDRRYIRPFLNVRRCEIIEFLEKHGLNYVTDRSNEEIKYLRNRIRHELLPLLRNRYNRNIESTLARTAAVLREEDAFFRQEVQQLLESWEIAATPEGVCLDVEKMRALPVALCRRVVKHLLTSCAGREQGIFFNHVHSVMGLISSPHPSGTVHLPYALEAKRDYGRLVVVPRGHAGKIDDFNYQVTIPGDLLISETGDHLDLRFLEVSPREFCPGKESEDRQSAEPMESRGSLCSGTDRAGGATLVPVTGYLDYERIGLPLQVRNMRFGDRMRPLGMNGTKKVKDIFIDRKIARDERRRLPFLIAGGRIVWIPGAGPDQDCKITPATRKILQIRYLRSA